MEGKEGRKEEKKEENYTKTLHKIATIWVNLVTTNSAFLLATHS